MSRLSTIALLAAAGLSAPASALTIFTTDFESGMPAAFSGAGSVQPTGGFSALGFGSNHLRNDSGGNPASPTVLSVGGLAAHSTLTLRLDMIAWDSWDGHGGCCNPDYFNVEVDGVVVFKADFRNVDGVSNPNVVTGPSITELTPGGIANRGYNGGWPDSAFHIDLVDLAHSASSATIRFFASGAGWQAGIDESWGIDNLLVATNARTGTAPLPGTLALLGLGLGGLGVLRRKG